MCIAYSSGAMEIHAISTVNDSYSMAVITVIGSLPIRIIENFYIKIRQETGKSPDGRKRNLYYKVYLYTPVERSCGV